MLKKLLLPVLFLFLVGCITVGNSVMNKHKVYPQIIPIKEGQLEYVRFGKGTPLVIINGYIADIGAWDKRMLEPLAAQHEVIIFNNPNVGASHMHLKHYDTDALASATHQLIKGLNLTKPAVLGYSMGGVIAQQYAVSYPNDISKLILINTFISGSSAVKFRQDVVDVLIHFPKNALKRLWVSLQIFFPEGWRFRGAQALLFNRFVPTNYAFDNFPPDDTLKAQQGLMWKWYGDNDMKSHIAKITVPTLILSASKDEVVLPENGEVLAETIPHAKIIRYEEGGHAMTFQFPAELAAEINRFLAL